MLDNLAQSLPDALNLARYLFYFGGFVAACFGVVGLMKVSTDPRSNHLSKHLGELFFGGMLMANDAWIPLLISSFTTDFESTQNVLSYLGSSNSASPMEQMFKTVIVFAQLLGVFAIARGMFLFKRASNPTAQHGGEDAALSGLMFLGFGSLAANLPWTLKVVSSFFGFPLPSFLV